MDTGVSHSSRSIDVARPRASGSAKQKDFASAMPGDDIHPPRSREEVVCQVDRSHAWGETNARALSQLNLSLSDRRKSPCPIADTNKQATTNIGDNSFASAR
jgi:hypothetical protein